MKNFKKILFALIVATSVGSFSTAALAGCEAGRVCVSPSDAVDGVSAAIKTARDAIAGKVDGKEVSRLIKDALDASKEINMNDKVDMARSRANNMLKEAKKLAGEDKLADADAKLVEADAAFQNLKKLF